MHFRENTKLKFILFGFILSALFVKASLITFSLMTMSQTLTCMTHSDVRITSQPRSITACCLCLPLKHFHPEL